MEKRDTKHLAIAIVVFVTTLAIVFYSLDGRRYCRMLSDWIVENVLPFE
jgi:hypothetical protein